MLRTVPLDHLPDGVEFPADLREKLSYDATRRQLAYQGFMSKQEFDRLAHLSHDLTWQRTVEHLFQLCVFEDTEDAPPVLWPKLAAGAGIIVLVLAAVWWMRR